MTSNNKQYYNLNTLQLSSIVLAPFVVLLICSLFWLFPAARPYGFWLLQENHPVEIVSFLSLFMAGVIGLQLAWKFKSSLKNSTKRIVTVSFYLVFSLGLIFVAMEEVSWGQWIFGFKTPLSIEVTNKQGEFNFHNIEGFNQSFEIMRVLFGVGGLVGIIFSAWAFTKEISAAAILAPWFVIIAILASLDVHNYYVPLDCCPFDGPIHFVVAAYLVEMLEMLIGLSALLYMWLNERRFEV